jgi:hypothetical protein
MAEMSDMKCLPDGTYEIHHEEYTIKATRDENGLWTISRYPGFGYGAGPARDVADLTDGMRRTLETLKNELAQQRGEPVPYPNCAQAVR